MSRSSLKNVKELREEHTMSLEAFSRKLDSINCLKEKDIDAFIK